MKAFSPLDTIMAERGYFSTSSMPHDVLDSVGKAPDWPDGIPADYIKDVYYETRVEDGKRRIVSNTPYFVCLKAGANTPIELVKSKGKYRFRLRFEPIFQPIHTRREVAESMRAKPNEIGAFTAKKVNDWHVWLMELSAALHSKKSEISNAMEASKALMKAEIESIPNRSVYWVHDNLHAEVDTQDFRFVFKIDQATGNLWHNAEFKGSFDKALKFAQL